MRKVSQLTREQLLVRIGAVGVILGSVAVFAFRGLHGDLPTDEGGAAALEHVLEHLNYALVHLGANLGVLLWAVGLSALSSSLTHRVAWAIGRLGAASALVGAAIYIVDFSIDGFALRNLADMWAAASPAERADLEFATVLATTILGGVSLSSIIILWGVTPVLYGVAVAREGYPSWLGWAGVMVGAAVFASGIGQFLWPGFVLGLVVYAGLPLVVQLWSLALGIAMWRGAGTVAAADASQQKPTATAT